MLAPHRVDEQVGGEVHLGAVHHMGQLVQPPVLVDVERLDGVRGAPGQHDVEVAVVGHVRGGRFAADGVVEVVVAALLLPVRMAQLGDVGRIGDVKQVYAFVGGGHHRVSLAPDNKDLHLVGSLKIRKVAVGHAVPRDKIYLRLGKGVVGGDPGYGSHRGGRHRCKPHMPGAACHMESPPPPPPRCAWRAGRMASRAYKGRAKNGTPLDHIN